MTEDVFIHPTAEVLGKIGKGTKVWHQAQVCKGAELGEDCILGKSVYVDKDVKIGNRVKLQNRVSVYHGVEIEDDVFVGPHVTFTNDKYPRAFISDFEVYKTLVKKGASIGAGSVILCGITLGEYCMIGSGSIVTKDVPAYTLVRGNPAKIICKIDKNGRKVGK